MPAQLDGQGVPLGEGGQCSCTKTSSYTEKGSVAGASVEHLGKTPCNNSLTLSVDKFLRSAAIPVRHGTGLLVDESIHDNDTSTCQSVAFETCDVCINYRSLKEHSSHCSA